MPGNIKNEEIHLVKVSDLVVHPSVNVRHTKPEDGIEELEDSIEAVGLLQPIVALGNPDTDDPPYKIMVGQRRWIAHKNLKRKVIKTIFTDGLNMTQVLARSLAENMLRVDLNHADAADAVTKLYNHFVKVGGRPNAEAEVKKATGMSTQKIRTYLKVQELASPAIKKMLKENKVTLADVKRSLNASGNNIQKAERLLDLMEKFSMTKYQKLRIAEYGIEHPKASAEVIAEAAKKPRTERTVVVSLDDSLRISMDKAAKALELTPEEVAARAIKEWLSKEGF